MAVTIDVFHPHGPGDTGPLLERLQQMPLDRIGRLAVLGKTEGPATLNDFSRDVAQSAVDTCLRQAGGDALLRRSVRFFSTGCEGIASPLMVLLTENGADAVTGGTESGLAFGTATSLPLADAERAGRKHIETARDTVLKAMADAGLTPPQVRLVLIKSPILSRTEAAQLGGHHLRHGGSTASSRGAAALGVGLALGEIEASTLGPDPVGCAQAATRRSMAFSGTETDCIETVVLGMRPRGDPRWDIRSALLRDIMDIEPMRCLVDERAGAPALVLFKAGIPPAGMIRGRRTTVLSSDLPPDKQMRAAASGIIAACFGSADAFISAGGEHLGPPGACLCTMILRL